MPVQEASRPEPPGLPGERGWLPRDTGCQTDRQTGKALDPWVMAFPGSRVPSPFLCILCFLQSSQSLYLMWPLCLSPSTDHLWGLEKELGR